MIWNDTTIKILCNELKDSTCSRSDFDASFAKRYNCDLAEVQKQRLLIERGSIGQTKPSKSSAKISEDPLEAMLRVIKKRLVSTDELAASVNLPAREVREILLQAHADGMSVYCFGDKWSLETKPNMGGCAVESYVSRPDGTYLFGWLGDTHLCSKYARTDLLADIPKV